jgi:aryl-alcohol dehydrogenase-like predicted oxidoreductase
MESKIILGTANFQKKYGLSKKNINFSEIKKLITLLKKNNIKEIDTAITYHAESKIKYLPSKYKVNTKIPTLNLSENIKKNIYFMIERSLKILKKKKFESILLHNPSQIFTKKGNEILDTITELKKNGLTKKVGFSVYTPNELKNVIKEFKPDLVQIPLSIADKRFIKGKFLLRLKKRGIKIHARSIFLQGLLIFDAQKRPKYFNSWKKDLKNWDDYIISNNFDRLKVCLDFISTIKEVDKFVVGFNTTNQLKEIINNYKQKKLKKIFNFKDLDQNFLIPTKWKI